MGKTKEKGSNAHVKQNQSNNQTNRHNNRKEKIKKQK